MRTLLVVTAVALLGLRCASVPPLSDAQKRKLDPSLLQLLTGHSDDRRLVLTRMRDEGEQEYAIIVKSTDRQGVEATGAFVSSAFGNILVVHATRKEMRKLIDLSSIEFMESGSKNFPQQVH
jgi:hypothetical protein